MNFMLWSDDGLNDPRFKEDHIHDFGHALDLLIEGAHKAVNGNYIFETIHKVVKAVYSEFAARGRIECPTCVRCKYLYHTLLSLERILSTLLTLLEK